MQAPTIPAPITTARPGRAFTAAGLRSTPLCSAGTASLSAVGCRRAGTLLHLAPIAIAVTQAHALVADHAIDEILARAAREVLAHLRPAIDDGAGRGGCHARRRRRRRLGRYGGRCATRGWRRRPGRRRLGCRRPRRRSGRRLDGGHRWR